MVESYRSSCFNKINSYNSLSFLVLHSMLALVGIMHQIAQEIKKFLWKGGKSNTKKFHMVN
jgi:ERCC4-type nuclease